MAKTRKDGDGSFRKKPNGRIEYTVSYGYDLYGKRLRKSFSGKTEAECRRKAKAYEASLNNQEEITQEYTLSEWLDQWLKLYKSRNVQTGTYDDYVYIVSIIKAHKLSSLRLIDIKPVHLMDFFGDNIRYSQTVLKKLRFVLNNAFEKAIDNDICYKNPMRRVDIPRKHTEEKDTFTEYEMSKIRDYAEVDKYFGLPMLILMSTGIRGGELRALAPDDIDTEQRCVYIKKAVKKGGEVGPPKNGKPRVVPLSKEIAQLLADKIEAIPKTVYIVGGQDKPVTEASLRSRYQQFIQRLNKSITAENLKKENKDDWESEVRILSPHIMRHTYSTDLQRKGVPLAIVSKILGHSSTAVTDTYTHLGGLADLRNALDSVL